MRLVNGIGILVAKLVKDGRDLFIVLGRNELTNDAFESGRQFSCKFDRTGLRRTNSSAPTLRLS